MRIRIATSLDRDEIRAVHLCAFPDGEGEVVAQLAVDLLSEETVPQTISLVAEVEGTVVGHVAFSPVTTDEDENLQGYILAPLGVKPDFQRRQIGAKLIEQGLKQLLKLSVNILFVYGDPKYYNRFGFNSEAADRYIPPYQLQYPFGWQAVVLNDGKTLTTSTKLTCVASLSDPGLW